MYNFLRIGYNKISGSDNAIKYVLKPALVLNKMKNTNSTSN